jgi:hypothetical protein
MLFILPSAVGEKQRRIVFFCLPQLEIRAAFRSANLFTVFIENFKEQSCIALVE